MSKKRVQLNFTLSSKGAEDNRKLQRAFGFDEEVKIKPSSFEGGKYIVRVYGVVSKRTILVQTSKMNVAKPTKRPGISGKRRRIYISTQDIIDGKVLDRGKGTRSGGPKVISDEK